MFVRIVITKRVMDKLSSKGSHHQKDDGYSGYNKDRHHQKDDGRINNKSRYHQKDES